MAKPRPLRTALPLNKNNPARLHRKRVTDQPLAFLSRAFFLKKEDFDIPAASQGLGPGLEGRPAERFSNGSDTGEITNGALPLGAAPATRPSPTVRILITMGQILSRWDKYASHYCPI